VSGEMSHYNLIINGERVIRRSSYKSNTY